MTCKICGYHKVCQHCGGTKKEPMPEINKASYLPQPKCTHCHGTGYCPVNNEQLLLDFKMIHYLDFGVIDKGLN